MMKLYWAPQSRAFRALWMLEEAGCPYERALIDIRKGVQSSPEYRAINPMMKVPALTDGEAIVAECGAICAYVAEQAPEAKLAPPLGDPDRGRYLRWLFFSGGCIEPAYTQKFTKLELSKSSAGWGSFDLVIDVLDKTLAERPWIMGERFSAADVLIGADLNYGVNIFKIVEPRPAFDAYIARCAARPAFRRATEIDQAGA